jgi:hypothetical protein
MTIMENNIVRDFGDRKFQEFKVLTYFGLIYFLFSSLQEEFSICTPQVWPTLI